MLLFHGQGGSEMPACYKRPEGSGWTGDTKNESFLVLDKTESLVYTNINCNIPSDCMSLISCFFHVSAPSMPGWNPMCQSTACTFSLHPPSFVCFLSEDFQLCPLVTQFLHVKHNELWVIPWGKVCRDANKQKVAIKGLTVCHWDGPVPSQTWREHASRSLGLYLAKSP